MQGQWHRHDAWSVDPNIGLLDTWHSAIPIHAASLSANNVAWSMRGTAVESPAAVAMATASEAPSVVDGTLEVSLDPGGAQNFSLIFRKASDTQYSSVTYDHGMWTFANAQLRTLLGGPAPLPSRVFPSLALAFHHNNVALNADGVAVFSFRQSGPIVAGAVGLTSQGPGTFLAANMALIDGKAEATSYSATFLSTFTVATGLLISDANGWRADNRTLTGPQRSPQPWSTNGPSQADGSLVDTLDNGSRNFAILFFWHAGCGRRQL